MSTATTPTGDQTEDAIRPEPEVAQVSLSRALALLWAGKDNVQRRNKMIIKVILILGRHDEEGAKFGQRKYDEIICTPIFSYVCLTQ